MRRNTSFVRLPVLSSSHDANTRSRSASVRVMVDKSGSVDTSSAFLAATGVRFPFLVLPFPLPLFFFSSSSSFFCSSSSAFLASSSAFFLASSSAAFAAFCSSVSSLTGSFSHLLKNLTNWALLILSPFVANSLKSFSLSSSFLVLWYLIIDRAFFLNRASSVPSFFLASSLNLVTAAVPRVTRPSTCSLRFLSLAFSTSNHCLSSSSASPSSSMLVLMVSEEDFTPANVS
mmetsp:Transcript_20017/g.44871  ORF Transcript_20017/g.44871 Transcript_20017/m.44871 type:complete len:231 (+) Transcript_20017:532-1224(+)